MTRALANEWAAKGANVNAIVPGYIATDNCCCWWTAVGWGGRRAARLMGAAEALREALHVTRPPLQQALAPHMQALDALRGQPTAVGLADAWGQGRAASLDATVAYALHCGDVAKVG